jgi:hypothetical protein
MRLEGALLDDSEERLGAVPRKKHVERPWEKRMLANRGFPAEATTTAPLHSDPHVMPGIALLALEIRCRRSVAHVAQRSTSLGRSTMR